MDAAEILDRLNVVGKLPVEAIRAASANRAEMAPLFGAYIETYLSAGAGAAPPDALFFMFFMLGEWREQSAYRPLARLLRRPSDELAKVIGDDTITEITHRVMAAVFDGDPEPLYEVILDPQADEHVRSRLCETIAMVTKRGELPRAEAARFLRDFYNEMAPTDPHEECWVWKGWLNAIAMLGLEELKPLAKEAFGRELISTWSFLFEHYEEQLQHAIDHPTAPPAFGNPEEYTLFDDTIAELSRWHTFRPKEEAVAPSQDQPRLAPRSLPAAQGQPALNPRRNVGRNDPCPCGSGKKFKKCCLTDA